jgi:hypothetical protein
MKIVKYILFTVLFTAFAGLTACQKDYLDVKPNDRISDENFYTTQDAAVQAVTAIYSSSTPLFNGAGWQLLDIMSDNSDKGGGGANDGVEVFELDQFTLNSQNPLVRTYFAQCYQGIQRANIALERIPGITMGAEIKNRSIGEAYFFRGFYYYMLVRLFGDVPLFTSPITPGQSYTIARSPKALVYETIVKDLDSAAKCLPATRYTGDNRGRVNKWAAKGLLASVYLTQQDKVNAARLADEVINSGVYTLNANYADNFDIYKENGPESLFEIQYRSSGGTFRFDEPGSSMNTFFAPRGQDLVINTGYGFNIPTPEFVAKYEKENGVIIDKRRAASIWMPGDKDPYSTYVQPASLEGSPNGYNVRKYYIPASNAAASKDGWSASNNVNVLRYAEVLLIAAEAKGPAAGLPFINQVRKRAGLPDLQMNLSDADYLEAVYKERQLELCFEMNRWFDLLRHPDPNYMVKTMNAQGKNAQDKHKLMPIPQDERDKNPNLTQNPGY